MSAPGAGNLNWLEANRRYLMAAIGTVRQELEQYLDPGGHQTLVSQSLSPVSTEQFEAFQRTDNSPATIDQLTSIFELTPFERKVLLLVAGVELDPQLARRIQAAYGPMNFSLALAALEGAHWSALTPARPLRYWRLVEIKDHHSLTQSPLRIDERTLHFLTGIQHLDERMLGFMQPLELEHNDPAAILTPSQLEVAGEMADLWAQVDTNQHLPVLQLVGQDIAIQRAVASATCLMLGIPAYWLSGTALPADVREQEALRRLWEREAAFSNSILIIEQNEKNPAAAPPEQPLERWIEMTHAPLILLGRQQRQLAVRKSAIFQIDKPTPEEQRILWRRALKDHADLETDEHNGGLDRLSTQFNLNMLQIQAASQVALQQSGSRQQTSDPDPEKYKQALWQACRDQVRPNLGTLAQRLAPIATWEDLILPESQKQILAEIAIHVRQRSRVYHSWGFAAQSERGLGISALFAGPSGTGKTMAAEVLANALELDLYRIDLSSVVSKYIGETEKNLRQVFDAAEEGAAILLFDEADALFGKRSEVKDSHDRYANIEVSYLLQRMESYRGLAILTTNVKSALDPAFLRRIRFVVQFPFPDHALRAEIWRHIFPDRTPTQALDIEKLTRLDITGGNIRNIALYAAFLAADAHEAVQMKHLLRAARVEYGKLEKSISNTMIKDWTNGNDR